MRPDTALPRAAAALLMLFAGGALAQAAPDAGRLLDETRQTNRPLQPPPAVPRVVDDVARPTVTLPEGATVDVKSFRITGASSFPDAELAALVKPWVGRQLDLNGLNEAAGAITRRYQSAGHVLSYAYLPAQKVDAGVIEIAVLEGRVDAVQVVTAQEVRLRDEVVQAHTEALTQAQPVLQGEVERRMLLLNDMPGVVARAAFTPGSSAGAAEVVVSVAEDEPLVTRFELDNHGSVSTGEWRAGVGLQLRDLFGWGDSTQLRALVSSGGGLVNGSISSEVPFGGDGLKFGATLSRLTYFLGGRFQSLGATGVATTFGLEGSYPALRTSDLNVSLRGGYETQMLEDDTQAIGNRRAKRNTRMTAGASLDERDRLLAGGVSAGSLALTAGDLEQPNVGVAAYRKAVLQLARQQGLAGPISAYARVLAQVSGNNLDSVEKLALGGAGGVRAYAPGEAAVDLGRLWTFELRYALATRGGNAVFSLFHDRADGVVTRHLATPDPANDVHLRGTGFGLQWTQGDYGVSASLAWRGSRLPYDTGDDPRPRLYLQLFAAP